MDIQNALQKGEEIAKHFNSEGLVPFPFEKIVEEYKNVSLLVTPLEPEELSGIINYDPETKEFSILVNANKPAARRYFTTAHEFGHFFLHSEEIVEQEITVDTEKETPPAGLHRLDSLELPDELETEANSFASSLIMPSEQVTKAWQQLGDIQACANAFKVSAAAMSIRLERLGLV